MLDIDEAAKEFLKDREKLEPVALQCGYCLVWSGYNVKNNTKPPRGWTDTEDGYRCPNHKGK